MHRHHRLLVVAILTATPTGCAQLGPPDHQAGVEQFSFIGDLGDRFGGTVATGSTVGLTNDFAASCAPTSAPDAAYLFTPSASASFQFNTFGSLFDTVLEIRDLLTGSSLGCNNDSNNGVQSSLNVTLSAGQKVIVVIDGLGTARGTYNLNITRNRPPIPSAGLHLWLRADSGVDLTDGRVTRWLDQSGNGRNASQGIASSAPLLVANAIAGLPVLEFDGGQSVTLDVPAQPTRFEIIVVGKNDAPMDAFSMILGPTGSEPNNHLRWTEDGSQIVLIGEGNNMPGMLLPFGDTHVYHELLMSYDGSTLRVRRNGTLVASNSFTVSGPWTVSSIGSWYSQFFMRGELAELIIYDHPLTGLDAASLDSYLQRRYPL